MSEHHPYCPTKNVTTLGVPAVVGLVCLCDLIACAESDGYQRGYRAGVIEAVGDALGDLVGASMAATMLGVTRQRVAQMVAEGKLPRRTVGNTLVFTRHEVHAAFMEFVK